MLSLLSHRLPCVHGVHGVYGARPISTSRVLASFIGRAPIRYDPDAVRLHVEEPPPMLPEEPDKYAIERRPKYMISADGPMGRMQLRLPPCIRLTQSYKERAGVLKVDVEYPLHKRQRSHWGTSRTLIANMIKGVSVGWEVPMRIVGIGYRATLEPPWATQLQQQKQSQNSGATTTTTTATTTTTTDTTTTTTTNASSSSSSSSTTTTATADNNNNNNYSTDSTQRLPPLPTSKGEKLLFTGVPGMGKIYDGETEETRERERLLALCPILNMKLGYSHPLRFVVPEGVAVSCPAPDLVILRGVDKVKITTFAAHIRQYRPPEPYNQKGVFVGDETIIKKKRTKR